MEPLSMIAGAGLFLGTAYAIGLPLIRRDDSGLHDPLGAMDEIDARDRKEQLLAAIRELDFDRALGKVSAEDHQAARPRLEAEAMALLAQLDPNAAGPGAGRSARQTLEADVLAARKGLRPSGGRRCPGCGAAVGPDHAFCPRCGNSLGQTG